MKEQARTDKVDLITKLSTFKSDVSQMTFGKDAHDFLKNKVLPDWNNQVSKTKNLNIDFEDTKMRQDRILSKLNKALKKLHLK